MSFKTIFPVWDIFAVCWAWQISSYMLQNEGRRALIRRSSNPFDHHQAILLTRPSLHQQLASSSTSFSSSSSSSLFWSSVNSAVHPSRYLSAAIKLVMLEWPMKFWSIVMLRVIGVIFLCIGSYFPDTARICFLPLGDQLREAPYEEARCLFGQTAFDPPSPSVIQTLWGNLLL